MNKRGYNSFRVVPKTVDRNARAKLESPGGRTSKGRPRCKHAPKPGAKRIICLKRSIYKGRGKSGCVDGGKGKLPLEGKKWLVQKIKRIDKKQQRGKEMSKGISKITLGEGTPGIKVNAKLRRTREKLGQKDSKTCRDRAPWGKGRVYV